MNRETWLNDVTAQLRPIFAARGHELPERIRMAVGFPSTGRRGSRIGECWDNACSKDGTFEIMVRPDRHDPVDVAAILVHELCHAAVGIPEGHGPGFRKAAHAMNLAGRMTATYPGPDFELMIRPILTAVGPLPHAQLSLNGLTTGPKKQKTRMVKCMCAECGYIARTTTKWIDAKGPVHCPEHGEMEVV